MQELCNVTSLFENVVQQSKGEKIKGWEDLESQESEESSEKLGKRKVGMWHRVLCPRCPWGEKGLDGIACERREILVSLGESRALP